MEYSAFRRNTDSDLHSELGSPQGTNFFFTECQDSEDRSMMSAFFRTQVSRTQNRSHLKDGQQSIRLPYKSCLQNKQVPSPERMMTEVGSNRKMRNLKLKPCQLDSRRKFIDPQDTTEDMNQERLIKQDLLEYTGTTVEQVLSEGQELLNRINQVMIKQQPEIDESDNNKNSAAQSQMPSSDCIRERRRSIKKLYDMHPKRRPEKQMSLTQIAQQEFGQLTNARLKNKLKQIFDLELASEQVKEVSSQKFYQCVKWTDQISAAQEVYNQRPNIYKTIIDSSQKALRLPKAYPIINKSSKCVRQINLSGSGKAGLEYALDILKSPQASTLRKLSLSNNKINSLNLKSMSSCIPSNLQELDLSKAKLSNDCAYQIGELLQASHLQKLNLEDTNLQDKGLSKLIEHLKDKKSLKVLNLSKNSLTSISSDSILTLMNRTQLKELYLHYNNLNQRGGAILFKGLIKNDQLKVLDLSYNSLGNQDNFFELSSGRGPLSPSKENVQRNSECLEQILRLINNNSDLIHLDLSNNKFSDNEIERIMKQLKSNETLFLHIEGNSNSYRIDNHGFIQDNQGKSQQQKISPNAQRYEGLYLQNEAYYSPKEKQIEIQINKAINRPQECQFNPKLVQRRINGVQMIEQTKNEMITDVCWICDGWQETKIVWQPQKSGCIISKPVFLHLSTYDYKPLLMEEEYGEFHAIIMSPPSAVIKYFFTNPVRGLQTIARDQLVMEIQNSEMVKLPQTYIYNDDILVDAPPLTQINYYITGRDREIFDQNTYTPVIFTKPRQSHQQFDFKPFKGQAEQRWTLESSFFQNYKVDNETQIQACFDYDFECSQIGEIAKDEVDSVRECLQEFYPLLFNCYKYYCSSGFMNNSLSHVGIFMFQELLQQTTILDQRLKQKDIDSIFQCCQSKNDQFKYTSDRGLVRHQFIEIFVRLAIEKYSKRQGRMISSAIICLFEQDGLQEWLKEFDSPQEWREFRFWNKRCDKLIQKKLPFLRTLFKFVCQSYNKVQKQKAQFLYIKDFNQFLQRVGVTGENLNDRDIHLAYLASMMTQTDELFQQRHNEMNLFEFIEALARVAEKLSIVLPFSQQTTQSMVELSKEMKYRVSLDIKLQSFLMIIYFRLGDEIKDVIRFQNEDDLKKFDICMIGEKDAKKQRQNTLADISSQSVSSIGSESKESSDDSLDEGETKFRRNNFDLLTIESVLNEQIKQQLSESQKLIITQSQKRSPQFLKNKKTKLRNLFTIANFVKFLNHQNQESM